MIILKYPIEITDSFTLQIPQNAIPLSVQTQGDKPVLWAMMDSRHDKPVAREFSVITTGESFGRLDGRHQYIGTFQLLGGAFVGHLFEIVG